MQSQVNIVRLLAEYKDLMNSSNWNAHQAELAQRNSSADWNDDSEFTAIHHINQQKPAENLVISDFFPQ